MLPVADQDIADLARDAARAPEFAQIGLTTEALLLFAILVAGCLANGALLDEDDPVETVRSGMRLVLAGRAVLRGEGDQYRLVPAGGLPC